MRIAREIGCGTSMQALRERRARQGRADAHQAALLVQGLRPELHRHAHPRQVAGPESGCRAAVCERSVDEPHRQAPGCLIGVSTPTIQAWLEQFAQAYAQRPEPEGRAGGMELDELWHHLKKSRSRSGSGKLGIVLQANWWTGNAGIVTRPPASA